MTNTPELLFESRRYKNLFFALAILFVGGIAASVAAYNALLTYGMSPGDGGQLKPLSDRLWMAGFLATLGIGSLWGGSLYLYRYVIRVTKTEDSMYTISTFKFWGTRQISVSQQQKAVGEYQEGRTVIIDRDIETNITLVRDIHAPYRLLSLQGYRVPFVLDMQAQINKGDWEDEEWDDENFDDEDGQSSRATNIETKNKRR